MQQILRKLAGVCFGLGIVGGSPAGLAEGPTKAANPYQLQLVGEADYHLVGTTPSAHTRPAAVAKTSPELAAKPHAGEIEAAARAAHLDPTLIHALIHVESRHNARARSDKGAIGLMQVLPETAQRFGVNNPAPPHANLLAGTRYLRTLLDLFDQRLDLALAAYNAGEGAVARYHRQIPPFRETRLYVPAVISKYDEWQQAAPKATVYLSGTLLEPRALKRTAAPVEESGGISQLGDRNPSDRE